MPKTSAAKTAQTPIYTAVPFMLTVLPSGIEKEAMDFDAPSLRAAFKLAGRAAADEQVVKAMSHGSKMPLRNFTGGVRPSSATIGTRTMKTRQNVARKEVSTSEKSGSSTERP